MGTSDQLKAVDVVELSGDFISKEPASSAGRHGPSADIFWVTPYQVAEGAFMRNLLSTSDDANLIKGTNFRA